MNTDKHQIDNIFIGCNKWYQSQILSSLLTNYPWVMGHNQDDMLICIDRS